MKQTIKKIKSNIGKVAGSALLIGATVAAGGAAVAQDNGSSGDLSDYPAPFVNEDGEVDASVVVGDNAETGDSPVSTQDVIAGVEVAGSLGTNAHQEVDVQTSAGGVAGTWSAENGVTLDRQNSPLFLSDATDAEKTSLDESDLNALATTTFQSEDNEEVEVEHDLSVGNQDQNFNAKVGDFDDPVLHVTNPTNPDETGGDNGNLFSAEVEFSETMDFTEAAETNPDEARGNADEWIEDGDTIELFGKEYTFSDDSGEEELVLYGSSNRIEVNTGEDQTITTADGTEVTVGATYVSEDGVDATVSVDGSTESVQEGDTVGPNGNIRVSDIFRTGPDGQGRVAFSQGSDELVINYGTQSSLGDVEVDGETIDGVQVEVDGDDTGGSPTYFQETDGMTFYFGAQDSDENYVEAGGSYEDPLFGLEFQYGGLTGDTAENPAAAFTVEAEEDDTASIQLTNEGGESATVDFVNVDSGDGVLAADQNEQIATVEGEQVGDDDYVVLNANEDAGLYQVTDITNEVDSISGSNEGDVSVTLSNVVTGDSVTIEETDVENSEVSGNAVTLESESVEGKDFDVTFDGDTGEVSFVRSSGEGTQVFPSFYTEAGSAVAFTEKTAEVLPQEVDTDADDESYEATLELPSTISSSEQTVTVDADDQNDDTLDVSVGSQENVEVSLTDGDNETLEFMAGETVYELTFVGDGSTGDNITVTHQVAVDGNQEFDSGDVTPDNLGPSVGVIQPEDDEDQEHAYFFDPTVESDANGITTVYTGPTRDEAENDLPENVWATADLDSEDNVEVGYNDFGSYTSYDTDADESETFNLHLPGAQSTSGLAVTGTDGSISASGGSSEATGGPYYTPTGSYPSGVLDSEVGQGDRDEDMVLVGGPSVNSLVAELASENETWTADNYTEGEALIQHIPNAFTEGEDVVVVAGYAAEDTRAAGEFLADYRNAPEGELEGAESVVIDSQSQEVLETNVVE